MGRVVLTLVAALVFVTVPIGGGTVGGVEAEAATAKDAVVEEVEFRDAQVMDAVRIIAELSGVNIVATQDAGRQRINFYIHNMNVSHVIDSLCRISGLWYRFHEESNLYVVMTTKEYSRDIKIYRDEPIHSFQLKYLNVATAARSIQDLFGDRVTLGGSANWDSDSGDDYELDGEYDITNDDTEDSNNDSNSSSSSNRKNSSKTSKSTAATEQSELSVEQLALLEQKMSDQLRAVSDKMLGQVVERDKAPIYVTVNRLHNMLFVRTSDDDAVKEIAKLIKESDRQVPEVLLEMKVLEIQLTDSFESAFTITSMAGSSTSGVDDGLAINPLNAAASTVSSTLFGLGNSASVTDSAMTFQALSSDLRMRLQLLQEDNNITSLATPMLLAANNHPAKLFIGEERLITTGYEVSTSSYTTSSGTTVSFSNAVPETEIQEIGNTLTILPSINADRSVVMRLIHENSSVEAGGSNLALIVGGSVQNVAIDMVNTSTLSGTVLAQDGMTVAIGGMMRTSTTDVESKVPVLGDIPLLGFFFKQKQKAEVKTELVLLITPHVLSAPSDGEEITERRLQELRRDLTNIEEVRQTSLLTAPAKVAESSAIVSTLEQSYIDLIRTATQQARLPVTSRHRDGHVFPARMTAPEQVDLFGDADLSAQPLGCWSNGYYSVTALRLKNRGVHQKTVDPGLIHGHWVAVSMETQVLGPASAKDSETYIYLVSDGDFMAALQGLVP